MSPLFVGPANDTNSITSLSAGRGDSSDSPIESNAHGREWAALNKGKGLAWVKISGFDGGQGSGVAFLVYSEFVDGRLYCMAARFAGSDSSTSPADNGNRTKWMCCRNPNDTDANDISDWGSGNHTFNEYFDYGNEGFCENCDNFESEDSCKATGFLEYAGLKECKSVCLGQGKH
mgnify:CR=1 FL=1